MTARTLIHQFEQRVSESGDAVALRYHDGDAWQSVSFSDWLRKSTLLAAGLVELGVEPGARVAIMSSTRVEWVFADQAVLLAGCAVVPVYETVRPRQARIILEDAGVTAVFVEDPHQLEKLLGVMDELESIRHVIYFDELATLSPSDPSGRAHVRLDDLEIPEGLAGRVMPLSRLRELGARALGSTPNALGDRARGVHEDTLASIVYTAGTTGRPRGVALTHGSFVAQVDGNLLALPLGPSDEQLFFLPLAQILARTIYMTMAAAGGVTTFGRGVARLGEDIAAVQPTLLVGVPRVLEKIYERATQRLVRGSDVRKRLLASGEEAARARSEAREKIRPMGIGDRLRYAAAEPVFYAALRRAFGKKLRFVVSGGAQLPLDLLRVFDGAGVRVLEGYGLTEHCAAVSVNRPDDYRIGTVGRPLAGVDVRIAADGEILLRSQCVMRGYWNDPEATAEALAGAWLHTGDIGELDGNYLRVTDRKKDVIVTDAGRSVAPAPIEAALQSSRYIEHAVVHGDGRRFLSALITLNETAIREWARDEGLGHLQFAELSQRPEVFALVDSVVAGVNAELPRSDAIRRFAVLQADFSSESGELTATWKTRRQFVTRKYGAILDGFYE